MFIDTHLHVADAQFDADRDKVLQRALTAKVTTLVEIAESPASWEAAVALAEKYPFVYTSLGIHPHHAHEAGPDRWPELERKLRPLLRHPKVVAIGEFGLDYFRMQNTKEQQQFLFRKQLELARDSGKPIVIHCRDAGQEEGSAQADIQKALIEFYPDKQMAADLLRPNGVIHCFSGTWADAQTYMMHGFLLGFDGPVTYPSAKRLQENVLRMPLQRMVLETDAPYLPPQLHRGQRNEPSYIPIMADAVGTLKHKTTDEVARQTTENARRLFRLNG